MLMFHQEYNMKMTGELYTTMDILMNNDNIASILFMGIDNRKLKDNAVSGTGGQADALYLLLTITKSGHIKVLSLNRDIMTDISRYDEAVTTWTLQLPSFVWHMPMATANKQALKIR